MSTTKTVQDFLARVSDPKEEAVLVAFGLAPRQMELFLAALNALPDDSLDIPNMSGILKEINISSPYVQELKKKKLIRRGTKRGEWQLTEGAVKRMDSFLKGEPASSATTSKAEKPSKKKGKDKSNIDRMSLAEIRARLAEIDDELVRLQDERGAITRAVKEQLASMK